MTLHQLRVLARRLDAKGDERSQKLARQVRLRITEREAGTLRNDGVGSNFQPRPADGGHRIPRRSAAP